MRILLINGGSLDRNGVCLFTYQWIRVLATCFPNNTITMYFKLHVVDKKLQRDFEEHGVRIIAGNHSPKGTFSDKSNREGIKMDIRRILQEHYDIIHIHSSVIGFTSLVLRESRKANIPIRISHAHGKFNEGRIKKFLHDFLRAYIRKESTIYAGCSRQAGVYLFGEKGVCSAKWEMVPNAIETDRFSYNDNARIAHREEIGISDNEILLGAVGYLENVKNHVFLIDIMANLKARDISAKLIIIGEGSLKRELSSKIQLLGLKDDIILYGKTDDVSGWLSAMDLYLMPSFSEGLPTSAVEAQASGLPCLLSNNISEEVDIIDSIYHLRIDRGPEEWVAKILELLDPQNINGNRANRLTAVQKVEKAGFGTSSLKNEISKMYGIDIYSNMTATNIE